tara:strand:+ start:687 stop:1364 length:678 start_codon:yes stop_codon:yes gene_type:complete
MKKIEDVCVIVQARLNSQRIPKKMTKEFGGTTLMDICIEKMKLSKSVPWENFWLSLYEDELIKIANKHKANVYHRSRKSAFSEGTPMTDMYEWWNKLPFKYCVLLNACAPFISIETIDGFFESYLNSNSDGLFGVMKKKNYFWDQSGNIITPLSEDVMNTKTVDVTYEAAHCLYAGKMSEIGKGIWMGDFNKKGDIQLYPMEERECLDIDYPWQFDMCETLWSKK